LKEDNRGRETGTMRQKKCQRKGIHTEPEGERYKEERDMKGSEAKRI
jgi:hypothetical protein